MRRLRGADNMAALAQKIAADGIGRDEDIRRLRVEMILGRAQEPEAFFRDFEIARAVVGIRRLVAIHLRFTHIKNVSEG
jgi:hypothetical protein